MSSPTKKRKRDADTTEKVSFQVSAEPAQQLGPVLASFPTFKPAPSTPFRCYLTKKELAKEEPEREFASRATVIAGEAETVEFSTADETEQASAAGCRYLVGVYNRRTGTVTVRPAPLHILAHAVKPLKSIQPNGVSLLARLEARAALGESFGTKKAKAAIRAAERNKVDVSAMEDVVEHLQETIVEGTGGLPTLEEAKEAADSNRLIPPHNADTDDPADVYPLHNIIPEIEWKTISVSAFLKTRSDKDRKALLPYQGSLWVMQHLKQECEADSPNKKRLKILYYISAMIAFRTATFQQTIDIEKLNQKMAGVPTTIVEGLLTRFSESARESKTSQPTNATRTNLLTHLFALCLRIDNYATDTTLLSSDLSIDLQKTNLLFKSLGCKMEFLKEKELKRLGLADAAANTKRAILRVPLEFPKTKMQKKVKRRGE